VATFNYTPYSIQDRLTAVNNRPSGFDYLRITLAVSIVLWHVPWLISGNIKGPIMSWLNPVAFSLVPMFFCPQRLSCRRQPGPVEDHGDVSWVAGPSHCACFDG
jgi:hypothetical protein